MSFVSRGFRRSYSAAAAQGGKWQVTVGLEIHAQLATPQKLFSSAPNSFFGVVNEHVEAFDAALPGTLPRINQHAVLLATRAALAFGCDINPASTFDRKHYFYPDQPAGYQITQNYNALAQNGTFTLFERDGIEQKDAIHVGISQLQLEQDTARTTYDDSPPQSLVDLNRNGAPLIEIVTTPSLPSAKAAGAALRKIQAILRAVQASDANMEAGGMRCDVNVSVTKSEDRHLGPSRRVEIKNLASGRIVSDAVHAESKRQIEVLEAGGRVGKETRGYNVDQQETFLIRSKESSTDYRYMPEPDLKPVRLTKKFLAQCRDNLPELPDAQMDRLTSPPYNLPLKDAKVLVDDSQWLDLYDAVVQIVGKTAKSPRIAGNWVVHELLGRRRVMAETNKIVSEVNATQLSDIIKHIVQGSLSGAEGKIVLQTILDGEENQVAEIIKTRGLGQKFSQADLTKIVEALLTTHPKQAALLRNGDIKIKKWFVGQIMKESRGKAKSQDAEEALEKI